MITESNKTILNGTKAHLLENTKVANRLIMLIEKLNQIKYDLNMSRLQNYEVVTVNYYNDLLEALKQSHNLLIKVIKDYERLMKNEKIFVFQIKKLKGGKNLTNADIMAFNLCATNLSTINNKIDAYENDYSKLQKEVKRIDKNITYMVNNEDNASLDK